MGYTAMMLLPTLLLLPFILVGAGIAYWLARWLKIMPDGVPAVISYGLIVCACYGGLYLGTTADLLIVRPYLLQKAYLGQAFGTPFALRRFDQWGFQDPGSEWRYELSSADRAILRKRCKPPRSAVEQGCSLFSDSDERWSAFVSLDGSELRMVDGLH